MNIYLCQSTASTTGYEKLLAELTKRHNIHANIHVFPNGKHLLFHLSDDPHQADIIYYDLSDEGHDGIESVKRLRQIGCNSEVIFFANDDRLALPSFDVTPFYFLVKNEIDEGFFESVFLRAATLAAKKEKECYLITSLGASIKIPLSHISDFEVNNRVVTVYYDGKSLDFYSKLDVVEQELRTKGFIRTHRSHLVNLRFIKQLNQHDVLLSSGKKIPVSIANYKGVKQNFSKYLITA